MKALAVTDEGVRLVDRPEPTPGPGEALLETRLAGICSTDLEIAKGYLGYRGVLGHEVLATVTAASNGAAALVGKRVAVEINVSCLLCPTCLGGNKNHCPTRSVMGIVNKDGGIAEQLTAPITNLHLLPDNISDEAAVFIEPLAAALHAFDGAELRAGDKVALIGDGKLGLLTGLALGLRRKDLGRAVAIGRHKHKLALLEAAGLEIKLDSEKIETGFDVVIEATGKAAGLAKALEMIRPRGRLMLKSTYAGDAKVDLAPIVINELLVIGSRCGDFPRAIDLLARGVIDPRVLISAWFPLADAERAFVEAQRPGAMKVLVEGRRAK